MMRHLLFPTASLDVDRFIAEERRARRFPTMFRFMMLTTLGDHERACYELARALVEINLRRLMVLDWAHAPWSALNVAPLALGELHVSF